MTTSPVTVIVPGFDEQDGIPALLARLEALREGPAHDCHFLFVDDWSSDGTFAKLLEASHDADWMSVVRHPRTSGWSGTRRPLRPAEAKGGS
ncbi:MAG: glycosyltransferase [Candidatus Binatia bacterium]|nr:glycosyltransferase [Candidatus Binatia bacterium]